MSFFKTPLALLLVLALTSTCSTGFAKSQNDDVAVAFELAAVVAGLAAQKLNPNSQIEMDVKIWLDTGGHLTGTVTPQSLRVYLERDFAADSEFLAEQGTSTSTKTPSLIGQISRTLSFGFSFRQLEENVYEITRRPIGLRQTLELNLNQGHLQGTFYRELGFNWSIEGEIAPNGEIQFEIQRPLGFDVTAKGKITPTNLQITAP